MKTVFLLCFIALSVAQENKKLAKSLNSSLLTGTVTDSRDGRKYKTVVIGTQTWMAENLNYDTADGTGSWCYDNLSANCDTYGRLYDWNTVMAGTTSSSATPSTVRGICPSDWHVPSDNEWEVLAQYVADQNGNNAKYGDDWAQLGVNLKAILGWGFGNGTDDFGLGALPAGEYYAPSFELGGIHATFWSATESNVNRAWMRNLRLTNEYLFRSDYYKSHGYSSRCVQDF